MNNTTHPASKAFLKYDGEHGKKSQFAATKGRRLSIEKNEDGYNATFYNVISGGEPVHVVGLTLEQADAIGWAFTSLDV